MKTFLITKILDACSNEKRIEILKFLKYKKYGNVTAIANALNLSVKSTSKHLQILASVHIIKREQEGVEVFYSLYRPLNELVKHIVGLL